MVPSLSSAAASGTVGLAIVVILQWLLTTFTKISLPTDVGVAISTVLAAVAHYLAVVHIWPASLDPDKKQ